VCLKVGRSEAAARAALTHTGALVGSDRAFSAVLHRYSALEVHDFHELVEALEILGAERWPTGPRIAGISESGGECALLADHAEAAGIPFQPLPASLAAALSEAFPNYLAPGNPLDAWGIADETEVYPRSLELLAESGEFDVLVAQVDLSQFRDPSNDEWCELTLRTLARLARGDGPFCAMTTVHSADPPRHFQTLSRELGVPLLRGPRDAMTALAKVARRAEFRSASPPSEVPDFSAALQPGALPEHESALILEQLGVPFAARRRAATPAEAAAAADEIGTPVVVKLDGTAHKAREGGVVLDVRSPAEAKAAARRLGAPVLVARQVEVGSEVLCGMTRDPDFGPILAVGRGGIAVEEHDVVLSSCPVDAATAATLVADAGVDDPHGVVVATLVALSNLALAYPRIAAVEVNPLIVGRSGTIAVDALVVVA
jgi:acetyltransferase